MSSADFLRNLRGAVRGLWSGVLDANDFFDMFITAIRAGYTAAFNDGLKAGGILPDEISTDEIAALNNLVAEQYGYITGFAQAIMDGSKANGGKLETQFARTELWANKYRSVYETGLAMAKGDQKARWDLGATERHCGSCASRLRIGYAWHQHLVDSSRPP